MDDIQWIMLIAFTATVLLMGWKLYAFLPTQPLPDDDRTPEAEQELLTLMERCIKEAFAEIDSLSHTELFTRMVEHETFDKEHYWRFNQSRLNNLVQLYYLKNPHLSSLEDIHNHVQNRQT